MVDMRTKVRLETLTAPAVKTSGFNSTGCHVAGYTGSSFMVGLGASADTLSGSVYWEAKLQESDTLDGTYSDVADSDIVGASTNNFALVNASGEDSKNYVLGYQGDKDYVRVVVTETGTHTNGTPIGVYGVLGMPRSLTIDQEASPGN